MDGNPPRMMDECRVCKERSSLENPVFTGLGGVPEGSSLPGWRTVVGMCLRCIRTPAVRVEDLMPPKGEDGS